jgi:hypothetical protein
MTKVFMHIESGEISLITWVDSPLGRYHTELKYYGFMGEPRNWDEFFEIGDF